MIAPDLELLHLYDPSLPDRLKRGPRQPYRLDPVFSGHRRPPLPGDRPGKIQKRAPGQPFLPGRYPLMPVFPARPGKVRRPGLPRPVRPDIKGLLRVIDPDIPLRAHERQAARLHRRHRIDLQDPGCAAFQGHQDAGGPAGQALCDPSNPDRRIHIPARIVDPVKSLHSKSACPALSGKKW